MASKAEQIQDILNELGEQVSQTGDQQLISAFEKIYDRLDEARKCFEKGEDSTGKKLTSRAIGLYVLKTWRMTVQADFNKFLVKKAPRQYRKMTMLFEKIHQFTVETLGYDYKQYKKSEDEFAKVYPFLTEAEKGFRLAGEREEDAAKAKFLTERAEDLNFIIYAIFSGKDKKGSILAQPEIEEKVSLFWSKIASIEWDGYISNALRNPTFVLNDTSKRYVEIMDSLLIKKFMPAKEIAKDKEKPAAISLDTDAKHLEFEKGAHKPMKKKGTISTAPKISTQKKIGGKAGKVMPRKEHSKFRDSMYGSRAERADNEIEEIQNMEYSQEAEEAESTEAIVSESYESTEILIPEEQLMPEFEDLAPFEEISEVLHQENNDPPAGQITDPAPPAPFQMIETPAPAIKTETGNRSPNPEPVPAMPVPEIKPAPEPVATEMPEPPAAISPITAEAPKKANYDDDSAVYSYSAKKQKEKEEQAAKEAELAVKAAAEADAEKTEGKKKGCLPFMIGITGTAILVFYYIIVLVSGN